MIPLRDLDSPDFMRLARSPEFSTYLTLRRYIWRSAKPHTCKLEQWYARGYLCCAVSRQTIARCLGQQVTLRSVTTDLMRLQQLGVIEARYSGSRRFFVLGRWEEVDGRYVEHYYVERLRAEHAVKGETQNVNSHRGDALRTSDDDPGNILPADREESFQGGWQDVATINRESLYTEDKREVYTPLNGEEKIWKRVLDELRGHLTRATYDTWVARTSARRVDGGPRQPRQTTRGAVAETRGSKWEVTCVNALAQDWLEHRLGALIRRELAAATGEEVGEVVFRVK